MLERLDTTGLQLSENFRGGDTTRIYETNRDISVLVKEVKSIWRPYTRIEDYDANLFCREVGGDLSLLLDPKYGLTRFIPQTRLAWGRSLSGEERGFIVMKKIKGEMIYDMWDIGHHFAGELDELFTKAIMMGENNLNLEERERKIPDIINGGGFINVMIGTTDVNPIAQSYIVDTYPSSTARDYKLETWDEALRCLERQPNGFSFDNTRRALDIFFQSPQLV
jgi:hypothetical protein